MAHGNFARAARRALLTSALLASPGLAHADLLTPSEVLRIEFTIDANTADVLQLGLGVIQVNQAFTARVGALYDCNVSLGTHVNTGFGTHVGPLAMGSASVWKTSSSPYTFNDPTVTDFTTINDGSIQGYIDFAIATGEIDIPLNDVTITTYKASGASSGVEDGTPVITNLAIVPMTPVGPCGFFDEPCESEPGSCCAGRPDFEDPNYSFAGKIAVGTRSPESGADRVVMIYNFDDAGTDFTTEPLAGLPGGMTFMGVGADKDVHRYSDPDWTRDILGSVFGVTLDANGNIYVTATTCYDFDFVTADGGGAVYRIDRVTGDVSTFSILPNSALNPALGNIAYDCANDEFYVTNHENGKIHRLDYNGIEIDSHDPFAPDDPTSLGFAPLGERVWGVAVHNDRLWFSRWNENMTQPSTDPDHPHNEIYSIALDDFGSGIEQRELEIVPPAGKDYTNPVSDIRFSPTGSMLLAERGIKNDTDAEAHDASVREYVCVGGGWTESPNVFKVGQGVDGDNASGGIDVDYGTNGRVWASADYMSYPSPAVYGYQGLIETGGDVTDSYLLDHDGLTTTFGLDKREIGDIDVSCAPTACMAFNVIEVDCAPDGSGDVTLRFTVTNDSGVTADTLALFGDFTPDTFDLGGLGSGLTSQEFTTTITGLSPGEEFCFPLILTNSVSGPCCGLEAVCITVPDCQCAQVQIDSIVCTGLNNDVSLTFTVTNLAPYTVFFAVLDTFPGGVKADKAAIFLTGGIGSGNSKQITTIIKGAAAGQEVCFTLHLHDSASPDALCCAVPVCFDMPPAPCPWVAQSDPLGFGGPGSSTMELVGEPLLTAGDLAARLTDAPPSAPVGIFVGSEFLPIPLLGGTLVPATGILVGAGILTDAEGMLEVPFNITGFPPVTLYMQTLVFDLTAPQLVGFSNAINMTIQ